VKAITCINNDPIAGALASLDIDPINIPKVINNIDKNNNINIANIILILNVNPKNNAAKKILYFVLMQVVLMLINILIYIPLVS
jgi:hypothetical protein